MMCYCGMRRFDDKLDLILAKVTLIESDDAEKAALRAEIKDLVDAADMAEEAKAALHAKLQEAFAKSESVEAKMRSAVV